MRFLIDRCAGRRLAEWLRAEGHDVVEASALGEDPGDFALLQLAARERRVLVEARPGMSTVRRASQTCSQNFTRFEGRW